MNPDELTAIADDTHSATVDGIQVLFRAYLDEVGRERLIWKIDESSGNNARFDYREATVIIPQGRDLYMNGRKVQYLSIPRWLSDAIRNDFEEFPSPLKAEELPPTGTDTGEDEEITPIFDDIPVEDDDD